jgi:class 3 adenylate cyclase/tetratricopeptide (TPR) repeat protein
VTNGAHRKVVTVLFCDVVGSTALGESVDPEALQRLLARYFERMKAIVESHGGSVEKFIGDAVMAVFGVPVAHEDDALRACRAAVEMWDALPELGVKGRIGVNTGEVLAGTGERLATGDAVNVAARLEQAAEPGEVLIGAETLALVRETVDVGEERPLELKGKSEPVAAYPLVAVHEAGERSHASRFVGRERELQQLADALDRAFAGPRCEMVTVVGDPGVGKSRLVAEALAQIDARVVRGRCLSYGEGITYVPVVEVVRQLAVLPSDPAATEAIRSLLGETEVVAGTDEIAWAFRKLLQEQSPLVVFFDDIQWGEETFLELIESTALLSTGAPLLLLCVARPELLDRRPSWPATLRLEPLPGEQALELVGAAVPEEMRERIVRASGGNPLFLTEMLALNEAGGEVEVPPTLRALLAARLDQLEEPERRVLECGAVEGELFHRGTIHALAEETGVTPRLAALVRRDFVRPDQPILPGEEAYRFRHLLIRDAAYDALPKATRADLHRRFAAWLEERGQSLVELDEILGYHLEQAALYLAELGRPDPDLAEEASRRFAIAGERARWRGDGEAAYALLGRAVKLVEQPGVHLEIAFAMSHVAARDAERLLEEASRAADNRADQAGAALARGLAAQMRLWTGEGSLDDAEGLGLAALPLLEEQQDHAGLAQMWFALAYGAYNYADRAQQVVRATEMARRYETLAGRPHQRSDRLRAVALLFGPRPVGEVLRAFEALDSTLRVDRFRAILLAMSDRMDDARVLARASAEHARELGHSEGWDVAEIESLSGNHETAADQLGLYLDFERKLGRRGNLARASGWQGRELALAGRYEEAEQRFAQARELPDNTPITQAYWRQAAALVASHRDEHAEAERLARKALTYTQKTDSPKLQADAYCDLAEVREAAGGRQEALLMWHEALDRYERKGVIPLARRVRARLAALERMPSSQGLDDAVP